VSIWGRTILLYFYKNWD